MMKYNENLIEINKDEAINIDGGFYQVIGATLGILSGVCLLAYGAGYLYGKIKCGDASKVTDSINNYSYSRVSLI